MIVELNEEEYKALNKMLKESRTLTLVSVIKYFKQNNIKWEWRWHDFETNEFCIRFFNDENGYSFGDINVELEVDYDTGNIMFTAYPSTANGNWAADISRKLFG